MAPVINTMAGGIAVGAIAVITADRRNDAAMRSMRPVMRHGLNEWRRSVVQ